jgi:hypothetical protein
LLNDQLRRKQLTLAELMRGYSRDRPPDGYRVVVITPEVINPPKDADDAKILQIHLAVPEGFALPADFQLTHEPKGDYWDVILYQAIYVRHEHPDWLSILANVLLWQEEDRQTGPEWRLLLSEVMAAAREDGSILRYREQVRAKWDSQWVERETQPE